MLSSLCPLILILLVGYLLFRTFHPAFNEGFLNYTKCSQYNVGGLLGKIFNLQNFRRVASDQDWDLYLPCGYNNVEKELTQVQTNDPKQMVFGISGCDQIVAKNGLWSILLRKYGRDQAKKIMPESYVLSEPAEMEQFQKAYDPEKIYILKKNIQRKKGLLMTQKLDEIMSSSKQGYKVVQEYLQDVFVINKRKLNLRIYFFVICQNGKVEGYIHKEGKCIYTNRDYTGKDMDFEANITSFNLDTSIYQRNPLTLSELKKYLVAQGYPAQNLFQQITQLFAKAFQAMKPYLCQLKTLQNNTTFQLFGADIIFNKAMKPYLLEINKGPDMSYKLPKDEKIKQNVFNDMLAKVGIGSEGNASQYIQL